MSDERHPTRLRLLDGKEVAVVKVHYPYTRNVWRVEWWDERPKGCLAERMSDRWEEVDRDAKRPIPLNPPAEPYE